MKSLIKSVAQELGVYPQVSRFWIGARPVLSRGVRTLTQRDSRLVADYLEAHAVARLQIGAGRNNLAGWLNTDLHPTGPQVYLDATKHFPLPSNRFDVVYSEHMIEHVPWIGGRSMLRECVRVLKPGGTVRIVTPDLAFLMRLLAAPSEPQHLAYIRYSQAQYEIAGSDGSAVHVVNNFMRAWGHQFIYDATTLCQSMRECGLSDVSVCQLGESRRPDLVGLAKTDRMPAGFLALESLVVEGQKA